ncbi:PaaI family thioesterase [Butyrivibrio sp. AE3006]|uniref:PaaI family thioesterase n=1 Tax=Butyrivibrio sp. AE3006 TaxID=1280673 RepID=UPI0003FE9645|nr:PaaI family thioesterase [Butyrivibrio sp. AE3006]
MGSNSGNDYPLSRLRNPFMEYNNIEIVEISPEKSVLKATITENSCNPYGMVHGGLLYTLMDCVAGITARADNHNYVTQNVYVNYLSNTKDAKEIFAESSVIKRGKSVVVIHARVTTPDGKLLSDGNVDMFRLPDKDQ